MVAAVKLQPDTVGVRSDLKDSLLLRAAQTGNFATAESLIAQGGNVNAATEVGTTALMSAAAQGHLAVVRLLVESGASIDENRSDGFTALTFAVFFGHQEIVRELIGRGADVHVQSRSGTSLERWAAARGFLDIEEVLRTAERHPLEVAAVTKPADSTLRLSASAPELEFAEEYKDNLVSVIEVTTEPAPVEMTIESNTQDVSFGEGITVQPPEPAAQDISSKQEISDTDPTAPTECTEQSYCVSEWNTQDVDFGEGIRRIFPREAAIQSTATKKDIRKIEAPSSTKTEPFAPRSFQWNTHEVDFEEGIRRIATYEPTEQSTAAEDYLRRVDTVPFSPFSTLVDRLVASGQHGVVVGAVVVVLFSALTFAALKATKPGSQSIMNAVSSTKTAQPPSSANQSTSVSVQQVESAVSSSTEPKPAEISRSESSKSGLPIAGNSPVDESQPVIAPASDSTESSQRVAKAMSQHSGVPGRSSRKSPRGRAVGTVVDNTNEVNTETNGPAAVTFMSKPPKPTGQRVSAPGDFRPQSTAPLEGSSTKRKVIQWP